LPTSIWHFSRTKYVIPAQAGIQRTTLDAWIPACAGMTKTVSAVRFRRLKCCTNIWLAERCPIAPVDSSRPETLWGSLDSLIYDGNMSTTNGSRQPESSSPSRKGVVGVVTRGDQLLVIRRSQSVEAPGTYCFPGGAIEAGETEQDALRREFVEELGTAARPIRRLWRSRTDWNVELAWWLAELPADAMLSPQPLEVASFHWLTVQEIRGLPRLLSSNHGFLDAAERGEFSLDVGGLAP
jgi:8-oxo-dGTP pyrophosphatase MutT (NUDIX family)